MKKLHLILVVMLFFHLILCSTPKNEVHIGYVANLSGRGSELWVQGRNGLELAIEEFNLEQDRFHVILHSKDNQGDSALAVHLVEELIAEGIEVIIGPGTSGMAMALQGYFEREDLLFLSATASTNDLSGIDDYFIRTSAVAKEQGIQLADLAVDFEGDRRFVCVLDTSNINYTGLIIDGFVETVESLEGQIQDILRYNSQEVFPFVEFAEQIVLLNPQGVMIATNDLDASGLIQQIYKRNDQIHFYSPSWANTQTYITNGGQAVEGSYQITTFDYHSDYPPFVEFREFFLEIYGFDPLFTSARYYELFQVFHYALEEVGKVDVQRLKETILETGDFTGIMGDFSIDPQGDCSRPFVMVRIEEGRAVTLPME